jgi:hypothetical protein
MQLTLPFTSTLEMKPLLHEHAGAPALSAQVALESQVVREHADSHFSPTQE